MDVTYNYLGEALKPNSKRLKSEEFGRYRKDGAVEVFWPEEDATVDSDGFDKTQTIDEDGAYLEEIVLDKGTTLCRYGGIRGYFTTDKGTPYELLSLPYAKETVEYHEYEVAADGIRLQCKVMRGKVAKAFDSNGGAVQYLHFQSIAQELNDGILKEVFTWLDNRNGSAK